METLPRDAYDRQQSWIRNVGTRDKSQENITVAQPLPEEGPRKTIEAPMTHPSQVHFLLFCEEGFPLGMFLSGGRLTTFLDSGRDRLTEL